MIYDQEVLADNYVGRRGKSVAGGMPSGALLAKWEQTGIGEDVNQMRNYHRSQIKDRSCEKPWLEADEAFNGGIDPVTGQSRAGGSFSRSQLNRRFGGSGARNNTSPNLPDGTFLDWEFLDNKDTYIKQKDKFGKNYTAGKAGVSRQSGDVNWEEYNRQRNFRGKYVKFYKDDDYSTVEHGIGQVKMAENIHKARFEGARKLKVFRASMEGRRSGANPLYERGGEKNYHDIDQDYREERQHTNYSAYTADDDNIQNHVDYDQDSTDGHLGRDNSTSAPLMDTEKAVYAAQTTERIQQAFRDVNVQKSLAIVINTLNNRSHGTQRDTEGYTVTNRKLGAQQFQGGADIQMNAVESRAYEIARVLQKEITNRKTAAAFTNENRIGNTFAETKIHEYLSLANRKLGPQEITLNMKEASLNTGLQPGAEVMDLSNTTKRTMANITDLPRSQLNAKIAHYRDDSRATVNFSSIAPQIRNSLINIDGEEYGANSNDSVHRKNIYNHYDGLKAAYTSEDMEFHEGVTDTAHRSTARGKGKTRRLTDNTHQENRNHDIGNMNDIGHNQKN